MREWVSEGGVREGVGERGREGGRCVCERERERERETERQRDREVDRNTHTHTQRERERSREKERNTSSKAYCFGAHLHTWVIAKLCSKGVSEPLTAATGSPDVYAPLLKSRFQRVAWV